MKFYFFSAIFFLFFEILNLFLFSILRFAVYVSMMEFYIMFERVLYVRIEIELLAVYVYD